MIFYNYRVNRYGHIYMFIKPINVIARSERICLRTKTHRQAKQSKLTLVGLLHFFRNDKVYSPLPSIPSRLWRESYYMVNISQYTFLALCHLLFLSCWTWFSISYQILK